ncbi:MAG: NFACT family protein [Oscillospiraceae bacterium]|jgi:predicted ribosome quality control (RQC) complex YloA/Tae2 family protein|nr:NFACT family protein [Oscillospiraceae bacterium]
MPVDAFAVTALAGELSGALAGGKIDKIHMPSKYEVHLCGYRANRERDPGAAGGPFRLLLSAHPQRARAHLTGVARENPQTPPMLCMLFRKHLTGGRFAGIYQPRLERVLHFVWDVTDEMGNVSRKTLVVEMIGRHSNIILLDAEGRVIDCLRRVDPEMSPQRPVLPGLFYRDPPGQGKTDPTAVSEADFKALYRLKPAEMAADEWIGNTFTAISPLLCRDIAGSSKDFDSLYLCFAEMMAYVKRNTYTPFFIKENTDFTCLPLRTVPQTRFNGTFSEIMDTLYTLRDQSEHLAQRASALSRTAKNTREKLARKAGLLKQELLDAQNREHLREKADLLMANLHRTERGAESVTVEDFYHGGEPVTIKLDPAKTPQRNAAALYKAYAKAKNAEAVLAGQIVRAERDAEYWDSVLDQLSRVANERELEEIQEELRPSAARKSGSGGQNRQAKQKIREKPVSQPMRFRSSEGVVFRAGRNNRQNDLLTMRMASKNDVWLHTQKIPGCHAVIETGGAEPGDRTLYEAACVAAWFSGARTSPKVPVDYTSVRHVKKPPGAKPGMVLYDRFKTVLAEPDGELAERLRTD